MKRILIIALMLLCSVAQMQGKIKLPAIISDNMVLQQKEEVKLWGWADAGEQVQVKASWGKVAQAVADAEGKWSLHIKTPKCCSGQWIEVLSGKDNEKIRISNILVGEVWLASGQSNMEFWSTPKKGSSWMTGMEGWEKEVEDAQYLNIHLFKVDERWDHTTVHEDCRGEWVVCSPETVKNFSAVAFLFARMLHKELQRPVGVILCAVGGTHAESWIREEVMRKDTIYNRVYRGYTPDKMAPKGYMHKVPSAVWNGMVNPIVGYTIKGNIWYQAESNAWRAEDYAPIFVDLVEDWRELWGQERLPFYFMQVAPYCQLPGKIRMEQAKVWENRMLEDIGMVTAIDVGDSLDIHPRNKVVPARRFADVVLAEEYGKKIECYGPVMKSVVCKGNELFVEFSHAKGMHVATPSGEKMNGGAAYLHVAGADGKYYPAFSRIEKGKLTVWHPDVKEPVKVKYCIEDYCKGNIYNGAGQPAYPFEAEVKRP